MVPEEVLLFSSCNDGLAYPQINTGRRFGNPMWPHVTVRAWALALAIAVLSYYIAMVAAPWIVSLVNLMAPPREGHWFISARGARHFAIGVAVAAFLLIMVVAWYRAHPDTVR